MDGVPNHLDLNSDGGTFPGDEEVLAGSDPYVPLTTPIQFL